MTRPAFRRAEGFSPRGVDAWTAALVVLLVATLAISLGVERVGWVLCTLAWDLPWAGAGFAGLGVAAAVVRRRATAWLRDRRSARQGWRRARIAAFAVATLLALAPWGMPVSDLGLSLRVGRGWRVGDEAVPPRVVSRLSFDARLGEPWMGDRPFASLSGWVYAPLQGRYHFAVYADGDALLQIDGSATVTVGQVPEVLNPPGVTDPDGFRRGQITLEPGFHRIQLFHRHERRHDGANQRLRLRWIPPDFTRVRRIPPDYLMPDGTPPRTLRLRAVLLAARRVGVLALAFLLAAWGGAFLARATGRPTAAQGGIGAARRGVGARVSGRGALLLLFFLVTQTAALFSYNRIRVHLEEPVPEVTVKFQWVDGLFSVPALPLEGVEVAPGTRFIRVRSGGVREFEIRY